MHVASLFWPGETSVCRCVEVPGYCRVVLSIILGIFMEVTADISQHQRKQWPSLRNNFLSKFCLFIPRSGEAAGGNTYYVMKICPQPKKNSNINKTRLRIHLSGRIDSGWFDVASYMRRIRHQTVCGMPISAGQENTNTNVKPMNVTI